MTLPALLQAIPQTEDYIRILPEQVLSVFGIVVMLLDPVVDEAPDVGGAQPGMI